MTNELSKWGAWGAGHVVYEDGSFEGMSEREKQILAYVKSIQRQDAMRQHPELIGKPGWGQLEKNPFEGWDPKADFSQWGKTIAASSTAIVEGLQTMMPSAVAAASAPAPAANESNG
jgi:hypothetical protein